jgi:acyl-coenzyme A thioesterase PaaI-like protein
VKRTELTPELSGVAEHDYPVDFYGFPEVPFHIHLGLRFERPNPRGPATVMLPTRKDLLGDRNRHATAALFTVGEVAAGIAICDALLLGAHKATSARMPLVLTRRTVFEPLSPPDGDIRSHGMQVAEACAGLEKLRISRKVMVDAAGSILDDRDDVVARIRVSFYVRLMEPSSLKAMVGALIPAMAKSAQETIDPHTGLESR